VSSNSILTLPNRLLLISLVLLFTLPLRAELRDPTRPSGHFQSIQADNINLQAGQSLTLQAIFYNQVNPGVLINGQRFSVGDLVSEGEISAIHADRIILQSVDGEKEMKLVMPSVKTQSNESRKLPVRGNK
jgi:hypothetical protein